MQPRTNYPQPQPPRQPAKPPSPRARKDMISNIRHQEAMKIVPNKYGRSWSSVMLRPNITFANQDPGERVYILVRAHWLSNLGWVIRNIIYLLLPAIVFAVIVFLNISVSFISFRGYALILLIYYSIIISNIIKLFVDWYYDPLIVTNIRILEYLFTPYASYSVSELNLENIEDIKESSAGFLGEVFNFGNITVLSENSTSRIVFKNVPSPTKIRDIITDLANIAKTYRYGDN